jgi:cysteinyl-tRNA synthetase
VEVKKQLSEQIETTRQGFESSMDDDFNTSGALGQLYDLVRVTNAARDAGATNEEIKPAQQTILELTGVLGLQLVSTEVKHAEAAPFVDLLIEIRNQLRKEKLWTLADQIRDQLAQLGVVLEDTRESSTWRWE